MRLGHAQRVTILARESSSAAELVGATAPKGSSAPSAFDEVLADAFGSCAFGTPGNPDDHRQKEEERPTTSQSAPTESDSISKPAALSPRASGSQTTYGETRVRPEMRPIPRASTSASRPSASKEAPLSSTETARPLPPGSVPSATSTATSAGTTPGDAPTDESNLRYCRREAQSEDADRSAYAATAVSPGRTRPPTSSADRASFASVDPTSPHRDAQDSLPPAQGLSLGTSSVSSPTTAMAASVDPSKPRSGAKAASDSPLVREDVYSSEKTLPAPSASTAAKSVASAPPFSADGYPGIEEKGESLSPPTAGSAWAPGRSAPPLPQSGRSLMPESHEDAEVPTAPPDTAPTASGDRESASSVRGESALLEQLPQEAKSPSLENHKEGQEPATSSAAPSPLQSGLDTTSSFRDLEGSPEHLAPTKGGDPATSAVASKTLTGDRDSASPWEPTGTTPDPASGQTPSTQRAAENTNDEETRRGANELEAAFGFQSLGEATQLRSEPFALPTLLAQGRRAVDPSTEDWAPSGTLTSGDANLRLSSAVLGEVSLHVRVKDSAATIRLEADSTASLEGRTHELARDLASQGLSLAHLELTQREAPPTEAPREPAALDGRGSAQGDDASGRNPERDDERYRADEAPPLPSWSARAPKSKHDVTA